MISDSTISSHAAGHTFMERNAWKLLLPVILLLGFFGVGDMINGAADLQQGESVYMHSITGMSWNDLKSSSPNVARLIDTKFRTEGGSLTTLALLSLAVCLVPFRKGERWAWFTMWALPLWMVLNTVILLTVPKLPGSGTPVPIISGTILFVISVVVLGFSARRYVHFRSRLDHDHERGQG